MDIADVSTIVMALLILAAFAAGYIDAVAGGGGMIQTLALLMAGIPPIATLATNKLVSMTGTVTAVGSYHRNGAIPWRLAWACVLPCLVASAVGSRLVMFFTDDVITWMVIGCVPVALAVLLWRPTQARASEEESTDRWRAVASLTPIGLYDGLIGPGTGTYMAIAANQGLGMTFLRATGLAKPLNLATNVGSLVVYVAAGVVVWKLAIPMAVANVVGAWLGSRAAVARGDGFIRGVMIVMLGAMLFVNVWQILAG